MIPFAIASRGPRGGRGKNSRLSGNDLVEISGRTADWLARMAGVTIEQMASGIACCKANPSIQGYTCYDDQGNPVWNSAGYTGPIPKPCGGQPSGGGGGAPAPAPSPSPSPSPAPAPTPPAGGGAAFPIAPVVAPSPAQQNNPPGQPVGPPPTGLPPCCTAIQSHTDPTKWAIFCKVAPNQGQIGHSGDPNDPAFQAWMEQNGSACLPQNQQQAPTPTPVPLPTVPRPMPAQPIPPAAQAPTPAPVTLPPAAQVNPVQATNPVVQPVRFPFQPPPRGYVVPVLPYSGGRRRTPPARPSVTAVPVAQVEKLLAQTESAWHTALRIIIKGDKCSPSAQEKAASDQATACLQAFQKAAGELRSATNELCAAKKANRAANLTQAQVNALNTLADCVSQITAQSVQKATKAKGDDLVTAAVSLGLTAVGAIAISV